MIVEVSADHGQGSRHHLLESLDLGDQSVCDEERRGTRLHCELASSLHLWPPLDVFSMTLSLLYYFLSFFPHDDDVSFLHLYVL